MLSARFDFSPEPLVSFSIVIKVWRSIKTALSLSSQEKNLTLPHPGKDNRVALSLTHCKLGFGNA